MKTRQKTTGRQKLLTGVLGLILLAGCGGGKWPQREAVTVEAADFELEVSANGEIGSRETETVMSRISGTIKQVNVETGDRVSRNQVLALVDDAQLVVQLQSATAALERTRQGITEQLLTLRTAYIQARTAAEQNRRNYESVAQSHEIGSASDEELAVASDALDVAEETLTAARQKLNFREGRRLDDPRRTATPPDEEILAGAVEVKEALANLQAIQDNLTACEIRAGISGVVTELALEKGTAVTPGRMVARIHKPSRLEVTALIDEVDIGYILTGQKALIESDSFLGTTLEGEVSYIAPLIKRAGDARVCEIRVEFQDPARVAKIGASCSIFITVESRENVPALPIESYTQEEKLKYAYKVLPPPTATENTGEEKLATITKVEIETGLIGIDKVEILSGLELGDRVIKADLTTLKEGETVRLKEDS